MNSGDSAESSENLAKAAEPTATSEPQICRSASDHAAEFAARQSDDAPDDELDDFRAALVEHAARVSAAAVLLSAARGDIDDVRERVQ